MPAPLAIKLWRVTHPFPKSSFACLTPFMSQRTFSVTNFPSFVGKRVHRHAVYRPWFSWRLDYRSILSLEAADFSQALMPSWTSSHFNVMIVSKLCVIRLYFFCFVFFVLLDYILWNKEESTNVKSSYRSFDIREKGQRIGTKPLFGSQLITNLTLKRLEEVGGVSLIPLPLWFFKKCIFWNPGFLLTFDIIISHIIFEYFIEILQVVQNIWKIFLSILGIFIDFYQFFRLFYISLLQRN